MKTSNIRGVFKILQISEWLSAINYFRKKLHAISLIEYTPKHWTVTANVWKTHGNMTSVKSEFWISSYSIFYCKSHKTTSSKISLNMFLFRIPYDISVKLRDSFNPLVFRSHAATNSNTAQKRKFPFRDWFSRCKLKQFSTENLRIVDFLHCKSKFVAIVFYFHKQCFEGLSKGPQSRCVKNWTQFPSKINIL